jgi:hypothetical protein
MERLATVGLVLLLEFKSPRFQSYPSESYSSNPTKSNVKTRGKIYMSQLTLPLMAALTPGKHEIPVVYKR